MKWARGSLVVFDMAISHCCSNCWEYLVIEAIRIQSRASCKAARHGLDAIARTIYTSTRSMICIKAHYSGISKPIRYLSNLACPEVDKNTATLHLMELISMHLYECIKILQIKWNWPLCTLYIVYTLIIPWPAPITVSPSSASLPSLSHTLCVCVCDFLSDI